MISLGGWGLSLVSLLSLVVGELDWAVHVREGGREAADRLASRHGMKNMGEVRQEDGGGGKENLHMSHELIKYFGTFFGILVETSYSRTLKH